MPMQTMPSDRNEAIKILKRQIKDLKGKPDEKKKEDKKMWWKRAEVTFAFFFLSPVIALCYLGILKATWLIAKSFLIQ